MACLDYYDLVDLLSDIRKTKEIAERHGTRAAVANFSKAVEAYKAQYGPKCNWQLDLTEMDDEIDEWDNYT